MNAEPKAQPKRHRLTDCYRGSRGELLAEFLRPQISNAIEYRRAVGFFSSTVFEIAGSEFLEFFARGGRVELVCSHRFQADDFSALTEAIIRPAEVPRIEGLVARSSGVTKRLEILQSAFLSGQLAIKIARPKSRNPIAMYHEKIGQIKSKEGVRTCFEGSANESQNAYVSNFERISIHDYDSSIGRGIDLQLTRLWTNQTVGLEVKPFADALRAGWIVPEAHATEPKRRQDQSSGEIVTEQQSRQEILVPPPDVRLRPYQSEAIDAWFAAGGKGILEMATGTGKTITALSLASKVYRDLGGPLVVIIVAPLLHLVDQWISVGETFGLNSVRCAGQKASWVSDARDALFSCTAGQTSIASLAVSLATFSGEEFQRLMATISVRTLLVVDEVHNAGSVKIAKGLPPKVALRLGLSATPIRHRDEIGTNRLTEYFGNVAYTFGIAEALAANPPVLTPYTYEPIAVHLAPDETDEYLEITRAIVRLIGASDDPAEWSPAAQRLLIKRARLVAGCRSKLSALKAALLPYRSENYTLVYCGDSSVVLNDSDDSDRSIDESPEIVRQIDAVTRLMGLELDMQVRRYTADTPPIERQLIEEQFRNGTLQALVAIRCLDEGVDIPATRRAFILASSTNPRQFVQRRGRVLRRSPGKERAEIFDFVVLPPIDGVDRESVASIKGLFRKELSRVVEFAQTATNRFQALEKLRPVLEEYDLLHLLIGD
jgi:superfamily II DNA or RNA helicase